MSKVEKDYDTQSYWVGGQIKLKKIANGKKSSNNLYWRPLRPIGKGDYRLQCPKCHKIFIMPVSWGVWKGCPMCWTRLNYRERRERDKE